MARVYPCAKACRKVVEESTDIVPDVSIEGADSEAALDAIASILLDHVAADGSGEVAA
jgi:hypothetical protein